MEKKTLSQVIEANEVAQFNSLIGNLAYLTTQLTTKVDTLEKQLAEAEETLELVLTVGEDPKSTVADLQEVIKEANKHLYHSGGVVINSENIISGSITASKITANSICASRIV